MANEAVTPELLKDRQRRDWDAAAAGWNKFWPVFERAGQHVSDRLVDLARIREGSRVLDVATGNGEPALTAARRAGPGGRVIATDQSAGMLAIARSRAASVGVTNVEFRAIDGEKLGIPERDFDAVVCRWGLMFMPDVAAAITAMRNHLASGGWLATAVWSTADRVPIIGLGAEVVRRLANLPPPPPDALEPTRLADPSRLTGIMRQAGFADVAVERIPVTFEYESAAAFTEFRYEVSAPFRALVNQMTPELRQRVFDGITEAASAYVGTDGKMRTVNETIVFSARR
jgi:ubiquinone/menaquinone biosynthesis C-methylase UbiE